MRVIYEAGFLRVFSVLAALAGGACGEDEAGAPPSEADAEPGDSHDAEPGDSVSFFVELLHLNTYPFLDSGSFAAEWSGDAGPGGAEFELESPPDGRLSLAIAMDPADGTFIGFGSDGLELFGEDGAALDGEVGNRLRVFGIASGDGGVQVVETETAAEEHVQLSLTHTSYTTFAATLTVRGSLGAGVYAVHRAPRGFFVVGEEPATELAALADDGDAAALSRAAERGTHASSLLAPGLFVVHESGEPLFSRGERDRGDGLERLAEDGNPFPLVEALSDELDIEAFPEAMVAYVDGNEESSSYGFFINARPGQRLTLAAMFAQSNDLLVATPPKGIALFRGGAPIDGDFSSELSLWDAGTEVNERPGYGPHQAPRQAQADHGRSEDAPVAVVADEFEYPAVDEIVQLVISGG